VHYRSQNVTTAEDFVKSDLSNLSCANGLRR